MDSSEKHISSTKNYNLELRKKKYLITLNI